MHETLLVATAAEHLVCADLMLAGHDAFLCSGGCPYDLVVNAGAALIRLQVKATRKPSHDNSRWLSYAWSLYRHGPKRSGRKPVGYTSTEIDMFAFVALDIRRVAYLSLAEVTCKTFRMAPPDRSKHRTARTFDDLTFKRALRVWAGELHPSLRAVV